MPLFLPDNARYRLKPTDARLAPILVAVLCALWPVSVCADTLPPVSGTESADTGEEKNEKGFFARLFAKKEAPKEPLHPVRIETGNSEVKTLLSETLPLINQQKIEDLDSEQMTFLAEETPDQVQTVLQTLGYFNGKVEIKAEDNGYLITVDPGPRTTIENVSVSIDGPILSDDDLAEYYASAMQNWALPVKQPFTQTDWSASKTSVLSAVVRKKYPLAVISSSRAAINPKTDKADLSLTVDSKKPVYFGDIEVSGTKRYPESVVTGMARFQPGGAYDLDKLLDFQQALEQDGHYGTAVVQADFSNMRDDRVPVKVSVSEMKRQKFELGLRMDSEDGPGGNFGYSHYNVFNRGYIGSTNLDTDKYKTTFSVGLSQPRQSNGHYWTGNAAYESSSMQNLEKRALSSGLWYVRDKNNIDSRIGAEFITESNKITGTDVDFGRSHAFMLTASWKRQSIETLLHPANGYYLEGKVGTTLGKLLSSTSVQRVNVRAGYYYTPQERKYGTLVLRGQFGYVRAGEDDNVPSSLMFRSGGSTSVRGYEQDSIGIHGPNNSVLPDRLVAVASAEYQIPVYKSFAAAVFHDAGSVSHTFASMKWQQGTGVGIRWFSPIAPFSFDLAYGHSDKKFRWHISLGTRF